MMHFRHREPVQLIVDLINRDKQEKLVSFELLMSDKLSVEKNGFVHKVEKKIGAMAPNKPLRFYFDIYPRAVMKPGELGVIVRIMEHFNNFEFVEHEYVKKIPLSVVE
jgi:hypothetical protein